MMHRSSDSAGDDYTKIRRADVGWMKLAAYALQTLGGIILAVVGSIAWELQTSVRDHEGRIIRSETKIDGQTELLKEIKADLNEIKRNLRERP